MFSKEERYDDRCSEQVRRDFTASDCDLIKISSLGTQEEEDNE